MKITMIHSLNLTPILDARTGKGYVYNRFKVVGFIKTSEGLFARVLCHGRFSTEQVERRNGRLVVVVR